MKKILLLTLAALISFGSFADDKKSSKKSNKVVNSKVSMDVITPNQPSSIVSNGLNLKGTTAVDRYYIGKSANIYSVLLQEQRCLDYNNDLGLAAFTFRTDPETYDDAMGNSGNIITATSATGETWADTWLMQTSDVFCRYPSGVVYNPAGNTDPQQAYAIAAGPVTDGSNWVQNFFASSQINGDNMTNVLEDVDGGYSGSQLVRNGFQATSDGMAHIIGPKYQDNGSGYSTEMNLNIWNGEFDGSEYSWSDVDVEVDLAYRTDGTTKNFWTFGNAWSEDGSVGYAWLIGQTADLEENGGYQPIVFKSEDAGDSWDEIEILLEDNETMAEYLWGTNQDEGPVWPLCSEIAGVVDMNNELQLFVKATGTYSTHPDSIGYTYTDAKDYIFNIGVNDDGVQTVMFIDSILGEDVADDAEAAYGAVGWDSRLQAAKSPEGDAVFAIWTDTENPDDFDGANGAPNIKAAGRLITGDFMDFPLTNFTSDDLYAGFYFYIYASQHTFFTSEGGATYINFPITTSVTPTEYANDDDLAQLTHSYVDGVKYLWTIGVEEGLVNNNNIEVSQNQPNPFTGTTTIEISSNTLAPAMIEVSNIMGQTVYTMNAGTINGTKKVELNASDLEAGVYFYTVTIGNESVSKKMIIE